MGTFHSAARRTGRWVSTLARRTTPLLFAFALVPLDFINDPLIGDLPSLYPPASVFRTEKDE